MHTSLPRRREEGGEERQGRNKRGGERKENDD